MSFKEQLAKHENILNRFKALYINNETQTTNNINGESSSNKINNSKLKINNNLQDNLSISNIPKKYNFSYGKEIINSNINSNINENINKNSNINNYENNKKQEKENIDLGKIDNLLDKLNFKRENNIIENVEIKEKNNVNQNIFEKNIGINNTNKKKFDIGNIKSKYLNNNINAFNITDKYYGNKEENNTIYNNNNLNTINNIKKLNQLNARSEIERIKSKYYSMNLNNIINKKNYLNNDLFKINNNNNYNIQLNKEILEIKNKIELYRNEVKEGSFLTQKNTKNESELSILNKENDNYEDNNISINKDMIEINNNLNYEKDLKLNNIIENGSNQINIPNLNFKYNINNNIEEKRKEREKSDETRKEIEISINGLNKSRNNEEKNIINNNAVISDININSNNQLINSNNNDFDYSDVLPIIDKVSKLKDLNEIDDNFDRQKTARSNITNINQNNLNSNEDEEVPNIVNSILDALSNKLITSNIDNNNNKEKEMKIEKPKLISKNNNDLENKNKKIISFKEFLAKEEYNNNEENM